MSLTEFQKPLSKRHVMVGGRGCGKTYAACSWAWDMAERSPVVFMCREYAHWAHTVVPALVDKGGVYEPSKYRVARPGGAYVEYVAHPAGFSRTHPAVVDGWPVLREHEQWLSLHTGPEFRTIELPDDMTLTHAGNL